MVVKGRHRPVAFVGRGDLTGLPERHGPITVACAAERTVADGQGVQVSLVSMADSEEITKRHIDAGCLLSVVVDSQPHQARPCVFVVGHGNPDVTYYSGAAEIRHDQSFARHNALAVVVAAHETVV